MDELLERKTNFSENINVFININFTKIIDIDIINQRFIAEVIVESKWFDPNIMTLNDEINPDKIWKPDLYIENEFENLKEVINYKILPHYHSSKDEITKFIKTEGGVVQQSFMICEIFGSFYSDFDFKDFPLDSHELKIIVASKKPSNIVNFIKISGKRKILNLNNKLNKTMWRVNDVLSKDKYEIFREYSFGCFYYPVFKVSIKIFRIPSFFYLNVLVPILLMTITTLISFAIDIQCVHYRLPVTSILLLTSVCIKWRQSNIFYFTSLDKYSLASLFIIVFQLFYHSIILTIVPHINDYTIIAKIDFAFFLFFASLIMLKQILFVYWDITIQSKRKKVLDEDFVSLNDDYEDLDESMESISIKRDYDVKKTNKNLNYLKDKTNKSDNKKNTVNWVQSMNTDYYTVTV
jgi:hypothetical protein